MGKIIEKQNLKRVNIIDSAYELFISKSFTATSIDDIVRKAGIAKGTFYLYFKDKYDLMDRIIAHKAISVLKETLDRLDAETEKRRMSFTEQVMFIVNCTVSYMENNRELLVLADRKFSKYLTACYSIADSDIKDRIDRIVELNASNGFSKNETMKKIYLTMDMVASVCSDAIIFESPFRLEDIRPQILSSAEKILA